MLNTPLPELLGSRSRASPCLPVGRSAAVLGRASTLSLGASLRQRVARPGDRQSVDDTPTTLLNRLGAAYLGYPGETRVRLSQILRGLAQNDEDVSGTISDYLAIVNPGHTVELTGSRKAVKAARAELDAFAARIFPEGGGLDGLANNQIIELLCSNASSLEWYPDEARTQVLGVAVVPAERVAVGRDPETGERTYHQTGLTVEPIRLDPTTYLYAPLITMGSDPHGIPMFLSALRSLDRKGRLIDNTDRVIDLMRQIALVGVELPMPTPQEVGLTSADDPRYADFKREYAEQAADMILGIADKGLFVGPQGTKFTIQNVTHSLAGLPDVIKENNRRVWTGLHTTAFLRGHMDSTTEALAKIVYPMIEARATNLQAVLARQLEFGLNLHLRLKGIAAVAYVRFQQAESAFKQAEAEAYKTRMEAHKLGKDLAGAAYARRFADDLDLADDEHLHAPPWAESWGAAPAAGAAPPAHPEAAPDAPPGTPPSEAEHVRLTLAYHRRDRVYAALPDAA